MQKGEGKKMDLEIVTNCKNGGLTEENQEYVHNKRTRGGECPAVFCINRYTRMHSVMRYFSYWSKQPIE